MKKILLLFIICLSLPANSQVKIRVGQTGKAIYTYYKNQGYKIELESETLFDTPQKVVTLYTNYVTIRFYLNPKDLCVSQDIYCFTKANYYDTCNIFNIQTQYDTYYRTINKITYRFRSSGNSLSPELKRADYIEVRLKESWE